MMDDFDDNFGFETSKSINENLKNIHSNIDQVEKITEETLQSEIQALKRGRDLNPNEWERESEKIIELMDNITTEESRHTQQQIDKLENEVNNLKTDLETEKDDFEGLKELFEEIIELYTKYRNAEKGRDKPLDEFLGTEGIATEDEIKNKCEQIVALGQDMIKPLSQDVNAYNNIFSLTEGAVQNHQEIVRVRIALIHAYENEIVARKLAESREIRWLNEDLRKAEKQTEEIERKVNELKDMEDGYLRTLEETSDFLEERVNLENREVESLKGDIEELNNFFGSHEKRSRTHGNLSKLPTGLIDGIKSLSNNLNEIFKILEENSRSMSLKKTFEETGTFLRDELKPAVDEISENGGNIQTEKRLYEELRTHVEQHREIKNKYSGNIKEVANNQAQNLFANQNLDIDRNKVDPDKVRDFKKKFQTLHRERKRHDKSKFTSSLDRLNNVRRRFRVVYKIEDNDLNLIQKMEDDIKQVDEKLHTFGEEVKDLVKHDNLSLSDWENLSQERKNEIEQSLNYSNQKLKSVINEVRKLEELKKEEESDMREVLEKVIEQKKEVEEDFITPFEEYRNFEEQFASSEDGRSYGHSKKALAESLFPNANNPIRRLEEEERWVKEYIENLEEAIGEFEKNLEQFKQSHNIDESEEQNILEELRELDNLDTNIDDRLQEIWKKNSAEKIRGLEGFPEEIDEKANQIDERIIEIGETLEELMESFDVKLDHEEKKMEEELNEEEHEIGGYLGELMEEIDDSSENSDNSGKPNGGRRRPGM